MTVNIDLAIRQAIGGDVGAIGWLIAESTNTSSALVVVMAAILDQNVEVLPLALELAQDTRDRQLVEVARASLTGNRTLVDALARDHLVDFPDSLIVSWLATGATGSPEAE